MKFSPNEWLHPELTSWVESANDPASEFPIQSLPFCRFRRPGGLAWCIGVGIGDYVLDLRQAGLIGHDNMARLMSSTVAEREALRDALVTALCRRSTLRWKVEKCLVLRDDAELGLPCDIGDYTDFYVGIHHATAVGKLFRPDNPLLPNYKFVPIGYHGRSSTIQASPSKVRRPCGQVMPPSATTPSLQASSRLDIELELGVVVGRPNRAGEPIQLKHAEEHIFGLTLLNDWSARDLQAWEYQPLGPFLSKNFATTISPWLVPWESLTPFRRPLMRPEGDPRPLAYLDDVGNAASGAVDVNLEVWLQTSKMRSEGNAGDCISRSNYADAAYWTAAQMVAHHTVNGCALRPGDLLGTGTLSGPLREQAGSLLELSDGGKRPLRLSSGEERTFLQDGDTVTLRGYCERDGYRRISLGECRGSIAAASPPRN